MKVGGGFGKDFFILGIRVVVFKSRKEGVNEEKDFDIKKCNIGEVRFWRSMEERIELIIG